MSYEFDVFVSYARADGAPFARGLVRQLEAAGFSCYLDEEQVAPGDNVLENLVRALRRSRPRRVRDHGGVAEEGLDPVGGGRLRRGGEGPAARFPSSGPRAWARPISAPTCPRSTGWTGRSRPTPTRNSGWSIAASARRSPVRASGGRPAGREAQGQGGAGAAPDAPKEEVLTSFSIQIELPAALGLDRAPQWGELCTYTATTRSEALFVVGPRRYGHDAFLRRVQQCLGRTPERHIKAVAWNPPWTPVGRDAFLKPLADAFDVKTEGQLVAAMRARLLDTNLVLVHQPVVEDWY